MIKIFHIRYLSIILTLTVGIVCTSATTGISQRPNNSCEFAFDDECDHPGFGSGFCAANTDVNDCRNGDKYGRGDYKPVTRIGSLFLAGCTSDEQQILLRSLQQAKRAVDTAINDLENRSAPSRLRQWFGTSNPKKVMEVYALISDKLSQTDPLRIECHVRKSCEDDSAAYSQSGSSYIGFCKEFFDFPDQGFDSRYGTIVHELTHMVADTEDYVYGVNDARNLARENPKKAQHNADNYQYFIESR